MWPTVRSFVVAVSILFCRTLEPTTLRTADTVTTPARYTTTLPPRSHTVPATTACTPGTTLRRFTCLPHYTHTTHTTPHLPPAHTGYLTATAARTHAHCGPCHCVTFYHHTALLPRRVHCLLLPRFTCLSAPAAGSAGSRSSHLPPTAFTTTATFAVLHAWFVGHCLLHRSLPHLHACRTTFWVLPLRCRFRTCTCYLPDLASATHLLWFTATATRRVCTCTYHRTVPAVLHLVYAYSSATPRITVPNHRTTHGILGLLHTTHHHCTYTFWVLRHTGPHWTCHGPRSSTPRCHCHATAVWTPPHPLPAIWIYSWVPTTFSYLDPPTHWVWISFHFWTFHTILPPTHFCHLGYLGLHGIWVQFCPGPGLSPHHHLQFLLHCGFYCWFVTLILGTGLGYKFRLFPAAYSG